jgi:uncharacterized YigZ family protein
MYRLTKPATYEQIIKKSRFLATAFPIADEAEAKATIASVSVENATHNCWAYRLGAVSRFSDDGEPGGTAGRPMLAAIDGQECDHVVVVVTRWFGGILLGSGGLVRAYGSTAANCLREAERIAITPTLDASLDLTFSDLALVKSRLLAVPDLTIAGEDFHGEGVYMAVKVPVPHFEPLAKLIVDLTSGRSQLKQPD